MCLASLLLALLPLVATAGAAEPDAQRGRRLLEQYQCAACHRVAGVAGAQGGIGPGLDGLDRRPYLGGQVPNRAATLAAWIVDPRSLVPGATMPALGASAVDARDMAAWLLAPR